MSDPRLHVRDSAEAYQRYLQQMDASMRQKIALTAAHLLCRGRVADMGMGSGSGSQALAALYPSLEVVGVDIDPQIVALAKSTHQLPNLSFATGDIATQVFPEASLDAIFDSSVLHHVTSFGGYVRANAERAVEAQVKQLKPHGVLIIRDFVDPGSGAVLLDVPADDGDSSDDPRRCSTAALLERFAREFRSLGPRRGFPLETIASAPVPAGWQRYRLDRTHAAEFILRKDYRADWESEVQEEYTYATQPQFEALFARLGLRVLASTPLCNPWIVRHRFEGKFALRDPNGALLEAPATNYVIVGERVPASEGVTFLESAETAPLGFLQLAQYRHGGTGELRDLVRRPNLTLDVLPFFEQGRDLYVLARMSYPRPILRARSHDSVELDGSRSVGYVTEPLNVLQTDRPLGETVEQMLAKQARLSAGQLRGFWPGGTYYPSPGGIQEEVRSVLVEIDAVLVEEQIENVSGYSTSGRVRAIEARQLLRAAQVGGLPDARLELNVYELLLQRDADAGPWIGETLELRLTSASSQLSSSSEIRSKPRRRLFESLEGNSSARFLALRCSTFEEHNAVGAVVAAKPLEWVMPRTRSCNTLAVAVLRQTEHGLLIGVDDDDLPAAQAFTGNSQLCVAPAWRLPRETQTISQAREWVRRRLSEEHGLQLAQLWDLGGRYHPSAGITPEVVYPMAVEVIGESGRGRPLVWVPLKELVRAREALVDGHLRIVALRAAHATGQL